MRWFLVIILLLSAVGGYLYLNPDRWQALLGETPLAPPPAETTLYKWQDESGQWQVSDNPPTDDRDYETLQFRSDTNIVPATPTETE